MPKLPEEEAQAVDEQESQSFELLPEGVYLASLLEVEVKPGNVADYWSWVFGDLILMDTEPPTPYPGRQWANTSLSENARWKLKEVFDAFGVPADTDTDELIGEPVRLAVSQRIIEKGAKMGQLGNNVEAVLPAEPDDEDEPEPEPEPVKAKPKARTKATARK